MDMLDMTDDQLAALADVAFRQGLIDGRVKSQPVTTEYLMNNIIVPCERRRIHSHKLRQIYGAGFDMARAKARISEMEKEGV